MKGKVKKNLYTVLDPRVISCLGGITGPIQHPTPIAVDDVVSLVRDGFTVYQHNPHNPHEKVKVTRNNFNSIVFKTTRCDGYKARALNNELRKEALKVSAPTPKKEKESKKKESEKTDTVVEKPVNTDFETNV
jgi:hypothetical protein